MQESATAFKKAGKSAEKYATWICLIIIGFYRKFVSPIKPRVCRFYPSCSEYTYDAISKYGVLRGAYMGGIRLLHCHPFNPGGYDPVD